MAELAIPPNMEADLGLYALSLRTNDNPVRPFYVERAAWLIFGGELVRINSVRVGGTHATHKDAAEFCKRYTAEHPGCAGEAKAVEAARELVEREGNDAVA